VTKQRLCKKKTYIDPDVKNWHETSLSQKHEKHAYVYIRDRITCPSHLAWNHNAYIT